MARTKGALNKRTRLALSEAETGDFANGAEKTLRFLIDTATDTRRDDAVRSGSGNLNNAISGNSGHNAGP